jgi:hypothetical protein
MATYVYTGSAVPVQKVLTLVPGGVPGILTNIQIGLNEHRLLPITFSSFNAEQIALAWNNTNDPLINQVTAVVNDGGEIEFTHDTAGEDFEIYYSVNGQPSLVLSETQRLVFSPQPDGGTFTLTFDGETSDPITYSTNPTTLAANIQDALDAMLVFQPGDITVTAPSAVFVNLQFNGQYMGLTVPLMTVNFSGLTGGNANAVITVMQDGSPGESEIQQLSIPGYAEVGSLLNERQRFRIVNAFNGSFTITLAGYGTTAPIAWNANRVTVQNRLNATFGNGATSVTGGPVNTGAWLTVAFQGPLAGIDLPEMAVNTTGLNQADGGFTSNVTVVKTQEGQTVDPVVLNYKLTGAVDLTEHSIYLYRPGTSGSVLAPINESMYAIPGSYTRSQIIETVRADSTPSELLELLTGRFANVYHTNNSTPQNYPAFTLSINEGTGTGTGVTPRPLFGDDDLDISGTLDDSWDAGSGLTISFEGRTLNSMGSTLFYPQLVLVRDSDSVIVETVLPTRTSGPVSTNVTATCIQSATSSGMLPYTSYRLKFGDIVTGSISVPDGNLGNSARSAMTALNTAIQTANGNDDDLTPGGLLLTFVTYADEFPFYFRKTFFGTITGADLLSWLPSTAFIEAWGVNDAISFESNVGLMGAYGKTYFRNELLSLGITSSADLAAFLNQVYTDLISGQSTTAPLQAWYAGSTLAPVTLTRLNSSAYSVKFTGLSYHTGTQPLLEVVPDIEGGDPDVAVPTVELLQNGGFQLVPNITGGTIELGFARPGVPLTWVALPYNATAEQAEELINTALGEAVEVSGGPLPDEPLTFLFSGEWADKAVEPTQVRVGLEGSLSGLGSRSTVWSSQRPTSVENCYDFTIVPGRGTPGLRLSPAWVESTTNCTWGSFNVVLPGKGRIQSDLFKWSMATPLDVENVLNEMFGEDVCRVYEVVHSQEVAVAPNVYGSTPSGNERGTYFKDVYRIVFHSQYAEPGSITEFSFELPSPGGQPLHPQAFLTGMGIGQEPSQLALEDDFMLEAWRTYNAFAQAADIGHPIHSIRIDPSHVESTELTFRYKLQTYFALGMDRDPDTGTSGTLGRIIKGSIPDNMQVRFFWRLRKRRDTSLGGGRITQIDTGTEGAGEYLFAQSEPIDWDAPAYVFQRALENMQMMLDPNAVNEPLSPIDCFGPGNIRVTGGLRNSDLSEFAVMPLDEDSYNDLRVTLTGKLSNLPFETADFFLDMEVYKPPTLNGLRLASTDLPDIESFENNPSGIYQWQYPYVWESVVSRPIPPLRSERQEVSISAAGLTGGTQLVVGGNVIPVTASTTAQQIEDVLNGIYGQFDQYGRRMIPFKWAKAVTVYGNTVGTSPIQIEWNGYGFQYAAGPVARYVGNTAGLVVLETLVEGEDLQPEIQRLSVTGAPWAGSVVLEYEGQETAPLALGSTAAQVQTALEALSTLTGGDIEVIGGPLGTTNLFITFAQGLEDVDSITVTSHTLINTAANITQIVQGGLAASLNVVETVRGNGPRFWDSPDNWRDVETQARRVPGSGDTAIIDDAGSPINFGLRQRSRFQVLGLGGGTAFRFSGGRRTFLNGMRVYLYSENATPVGLDEGYYFVRNPQPNGTFQLSSTANGSFIQVSSVGIGTLWLEVRDLTLNVYARFGGQVIGLPNRRDNGFEEYLARYLECGYEKIDLGLDNGPGLSLGRFNTLDLPVPGGVRVRLSSSPQQAPAAVLFLINNDEVDLQIDDGDVGLSVYADESSMLNDIVHSGGLLTLRNADVRGNYLPSGSAVANISRTTVSGTYNP